MNKSLWIADSDITNYPKLENDVSTDACVIGGGITGAVTAYLLSKEGLNVILLEKGKVCMGVTSKSTAKLTSQHGLIYKYLKDEKGIEFAKKYLNANEEGINLAKSIIENEKIDCDYENMNAVVFATTESELKKVNDEVRVLKEIGYDAEFVKDIDIPAKKVYGGIKFKNQGQFNPRKYTIELMKRFSEMGGKIYENSKVVNIEKCKNGYNVSTENGNVYSKYVVIASHYPIKNFPGMYFIKMYQDKSYVIAVEIGEKNGKKSDLDNSYFIQSCNPIISFRRAKYGDKNVLLVAGGGHKTGDTNVKRDDIYNELFNYIKNYYSDCKLIFKWSTEDCVSLDKIPYIGKFSNFMPNVYVATGFKKWGMSTSHIAGKIISDLIIDGKSSYEDVFKATRVEPIRNKKEFGNIIKQSTYSLFINKPKKSCEEFEDIKLGDGGIVEIDGKKVGVYKREDGEVFAVNPVCKHLGCLLSWNNLEKTWDCPCHGSRYDYMGNMICEPTVKDLDRIEIVSYEDFM